MAVQVLIAQGYSQIVYGDGMITSRNTFQKYFDQEDLKLYINQVMGVDAAPVALGIYCDLATVVQTDIKRLFGDYQHLHGSRFSVDEPGQFGDSGRTMSEQSAQEEAA